VGEPDKHGSQRAVGGKKSLGGFDRDGHPKWIGSPGRERGQKMWEANKHWEALIDVENQKGGRRRQRGRPKIFVSL